MNYWLVKSEPSAWSWDQQVAKGAKGEAWTGVRNFTARQNLVNMKKRDRAASKDGRMGPHGSGRRVAAPHHEEGLSRRRRHDLRQQRFPLRLRAIALHGRGKALEDAIFEGGNDGVVDVALAADRRRI